MAYNGIHSGDRRARKLKAKSKVIPEVNISLLYSAYVMPFKVSNDYKGFSGGGSIISTRSII